MTLPLLERHSGLSGKQCREFPTVSGTPGGQWVLTIRKLDSGEMKRVFPGRAVLRFYLGSCQGVSPSSSSTNG